MKIQLANEQIWYSVIQGTGAISTIVGRAYNVSYITYSK